MSISPSQHGEPESWHGTIGLSNENDPSGRCVNTGSPAGASPSIRYQRRGLPIMVAETPPTKTTVRKIVDADHGPVWRVTHACGCPFVNRLTWHVAMIFATRHRCPRPWPSERVYPYSESGGLMCMDHLLNGWPQDKDCPCIEPMVRRRNAQIILNGGR